jgi:hypothetical protein
MGWYARCRLLKALEDLKTPGTMPLGAWSEVVEEAIRVACPTESGLHDRVKALRPTTAERPGEVNLSDPRITEYPGYLSAAQKIVKLRLPPPKPSDPTLEQEVVAIVNDKLLETPIVKVLKWGLPMLLAVIFGGTIWAGFEVSGIYNKAKAHVESLTAEVDRKRQEGIERIEAAIGDDKRQTGALGDIRNLRESAKGRIEGAVGTDNSQGTALGALGEIASKKNKAIADIAAAVGSETSETGAIAAIKQREKDALQRMLDRITALERKLKGFDPAAIKITEANEILSRHVAPVSPDAIGLLLKHSLITLTMIGFVAGGLGSLAVMAPIVLYRWLGTRRRLAWTVVGVGVLLALGSAFADPLGLGRYPGFGWVQGLGVGIGAGLTILAGASLWFRRKKTSP